jgi:hypothetical protein
MNEYENQLTERANGMLARKAQNLDVDPLDAFEGIDWSQDRVNDAFFSKLINAKVIRATDLTKCKAQERAKGKLYAALGCVPSTPYEFVTAMTTKLSVTTDWKGVLMIGGRFQTILDLRRVLRIKSVELSLDFQRWDVDDACDQFYEEAKALRPDILDAEFSARKSFDWDSFARTYFKETDDLNFEMIAAILRKFIHQARRKLAGLKVMHHLMPVIHGPQGCGKTFLLEKMLSPISEATSWSDFDQITDDRNHDLWNSLVIVLDEMARANKADVETIKHVITAETLDRRPMRSNATFPVQNRAVLIGASNHRLDELIKDETGNRRFVELIFNTKAPRDVSFDFRAMWASVQPGDADPLDAHRPALAKAQEAYAVKGPVQDWLDSCKADRLFWAAGVNGVNTNDLYDDFRNHRATVTAGIDYQARTLNTFASELRRVVEQIETYQISKKHTRNGSRWFCDKPAPLKLVELGDR